MPRDVCDFCSNPDVAWRYLCKTFMHKSDLPIVNIHMQEEWISCGYCARLINNGQDDALAQRIIRVSVQYRVVYRMLSEEDKILLHAELKKLHENFRKSRLYGPPVRL